MTHLRTPILLLALTLAGTGSAVAQEGAGYVLPNDEIQRLFATDKNFVQLDHLSPDGNHFLVLHETELSTLERMGEPTLRLAELELRPAVDRIWPALTKIAIDLAAKGRGLAGMQLGLTPSGRL